MGNLGRSWEILGDLGRWLTCRSSAISQSITVSLRVFTTINGRAMRAEGGAAAAPAGERLRAMSCLKETC